MSLNIIVAFTHKKFGIGFENTLPWNIPEDLQFFNTITTGGVVVMGRNTWLSIPTDKRPLKHRQNIIVSQQYNTSIKDVDEYIKTHKQCDIFIIGGASLYKEYMGRVDNIYATIIEKEFTCDTFFPINNFDKYKISEYSNRMYSQEEECFYRQIKYSKQDEHTYRHDEHAYLDLMKTILESGEYTIDRTQIGTKSVFAPNPLRFDVSDSIPLFTTKFMNYKIILEELLWFLRGDTNSDILEDKGIVIWRPNTTREFLDSRGLFHHAEKDIGPMYGWIWNHIGAEYNGCTEDYDGKGINQLEKLMQGLRKDPYSRRHIITTFCPMYTDLGCLMPCHGIVCQFNVSKEYLSCHVYNRSQDVFLGQPFNITSYAILLHIIAAKCGYKPKELVISMGNTHIYSNHEEQCINQLKRQVLPFPILEMSPHIQDLPFKDMISDDFKLVGYIHHPGIKAAMAI